MSLAAKLKHVKAPVKRTAPIWKGPESDGPQGGITFSLLNRWLQCRERFRLLVVEGLRPRDSFQFKIEYGNMWHVCEEAFAEYGNSTEWAWENKLKEYAKNLCRRYPMQQEQIDHWYNVCRAQFPLYGDYWSKHPDVKNRTPLLQEQVFSVPYKLPSGRTVYLRGKWDSVDLVSEILAGTKGKVGSVWLMENKTKGRIDEGQMQRQLSFDLQTMLYIVALQFGTKEWCPRCGIGSTGHDPNIVGVRYNTIRRPLSGGAGSITRRKATQGAKCPKCKGSDRIVSCTKCRGAGRIGAKPEETKPAFYERLRGIIAAEPETYFMRWNVMLTPSDVERFRRECLDPILEQLCDWWSWIALSGSNPFNPSDGCENSTGESVRSNIHWRHPYGIRVLDENMSTDMDAHLASGSEVGLQRVENLFTELT